MERELRKGKRKNGNLGIEKPLISNGDPPNDVAKRNNDWRVWHVDVQRIFPRGSRRRTSR